MQEYDSQIVFIKGFGAFTRLCELIWISIVLDASRGARGDSECGNLYEFACWELVVCVYSILSVFATRKEIKCADALICSVSVIWIFVAWCNYFDGTCRAEYHANHNHLYWYILFKLWFTVAILCFVGFFCVGTVILLVANPSLLERDDGPYLPRTVSIYGAYNGSVARPLPIERPLPVVSLPVAPMVPELEILEEIVEVRPEVGEVGGEADEEEGR